MIAARLAALRIVRTPRALVPAGAWLLLAFVAAGVERSRAWPAAGHVLTGAFGGIALPLFVYTIVGATMAGGGVTRAARPLVALGADPVRAAGSFVLVAVAASGAASAIAGALVAVIAHGPSDPSLVSDLFVTARVAALAGAAYAAYFALGAALFRNGMGRGVLLAVDWIFGDGPGVSSLLTPRAHLRSLLGGGAAFELSQRASTALLVGIGVLYVGLALAVVKRQRG